MDPQNLGGQAPGLIYSKGVVAWERSHLVRLLAQGYLLPLDYDPFMSTPTGFGSTKPTTIVSSSPLRRAATYDRGLHWKPHIRLLNRGRYLVEFLSDGEIGKWNEIDSYIFEHKTPP